jgi:hypothetical protein
MGTRTLVATRAKSPQFIYRNVPAGLKTRSPGIKEAGMNLKSSA